MTLAERPTPTAPPGLVAQPAANRNVLASAALVLAIVFGAFLAPLTVIMGFIARAQIKRTGERGADSALAAIVVSCVFLVAMGVLAGAIGLGGSSEPTGPRAVDKADVARQIGTQLLEKMGRAPEIVECPDNLEAKVNATVICVLTDQGKSYNVTATVTGVADGAVAFGVQVASEPNP